MTAFILLSLAMSKVYSNAGIDSSNDIDMILKPAHWINPCSKSPLKGTPTCDTRKSFEERAHDLVYNQESKLSSHGLTAYQDLSGNSAKSVSDLNIPTYQWWNEGLHGIANCMGISYDGPIKNTTMFPQVITTASSFNASLFHMIAQAIATEARAMNNNFQAGLTFWSPNINIFRDPRWGRGQETPGEDPFLTSTYATQFVSGMEGDDPKYIKASSCCKHYADYSQETDRTSFNAIVTDYDQNDTYLVAFKYCAISGASGVMCSFNAENGIPSCANKYIMTTLLRDTWGFNGYITSDCKAVSDVENAHHYTNTTGATINDVYGAGMDIDCGSYSQTYLQSAVQDGDAAMSIIQTAMYRAALVQFRVGMFDDPSSTPWSNLGPKDVCTPNHLALALDAARQGTVLLKNMNNALPLKSKPSSIALIGPNADNSDVMKGSYYGDAPFIRTVLDGLSMYVAASTINYQYGVDINSKNSSGIASAVNAAKNADITIMVMGLDETQEREDHDRGSIALPGLQNNLIEQVCNAAKGNVILIILSGGCVDISQWRVSNNIKSIIWAGYPGMYGGEAIADVIFGAFNPTGRLDQTWYYTNYTQQISLEQYQMRPNSSIKSPGRGYRYFNGDVVYSFGDGMSFSTFTCTEAQETNKQIILTVKNSGNVSGGAAVLVYFVPTNGGQNGVEKKRLIAFGRANMLKSGDSQQLKMDIYREFINSQEHNDMKGKYVVSCMGDMSN